MDEYDIEQAFAAIEEELINSMMRNMKRHRVEETAEGIEWSMWQAEQLKEFEACKKQNSGKFQKKFSDINSQVEELITKAREQGNMDQEIKILEALKKGYNSKARNKSVVTQGEFFRLNDRKLNALINATKSDMVKAETAMLRMANDQYRSTIFNAQMYANSGAGTYEQAVDMATKDFLSRGINCIQYKNGARVNIASYASMAIRTANKRAYLTGEGEKRQEWGISTVITANRGAACPKCIPFTSKVFVDDVWSGGKASDGPYPLLSSAIAAGFYHPNCKDSHTTYFEGVSTPPKNLTKADIEKSKENYMLQQEQRCNERMVRKYKMLENGTLDDSNREYYRNKANEWKKKNQDFIKQHSDVLREKTSNYKDRGLKLDTKDQGEFIDRIKETLNPISKPVKAFQKGLDNVSDPDVKTLLEQSLGRTEIKKSNRNKSYFSKNEKTVYLSTDCLPSTVAHELFHEIDHTYGIAESGMLSDALKSDFNTMSQVANKYGGSLENMLYSKYPKMFLEGDFGHLVVSEQYRGLSDIINGLSRGEVNLGYRHSIEYWKRPLAVEREAWAQYGRIIYENNPEVLEVLFELLPETNKSMSNILKGMIK